MTDEINLTEFNSNLATLQRVDMLLRFASDSHYNNDLLSYFKHLRNLRKEIIVKMRGKKYEDKRKEIEDIYADLKKKAQVYLSNSSNLRLNIQLEIKLNLFEDKLRDFADLKGMLLTEKENEAWGSLK